MDLNSTVEKESKSKGGIARLVDLYLSHRLAQLAFVTWVLILSPYTQRLLSRLRGSLLVIGIISFTFLSTYVMLNLMLKAKGEYKSLRDLLPKGGDARSPGEFLKYIYTIDDDPEKSSAPNYAKERRIRKLVGSMGFLTLYRVLGAIESKIDNKIFSYVKLAIFAISLIPILFWSWVVVSTLKELFKSKSSYQDKAMSLLDRVTNLVIFPISPKAAPAPSK